MPYRRELFILYCLGLMEAVAGFTLLIGVGLVSADPLHGGIFWLLLPATWIGTSSALALGAVDEVSGAGRVGLALLILLLCSLPPVLLLRADVSAIVLTALLIVFFLWRGTLVTAREADHFEVQRRFSLRLALILLGIVILVARGETENGILWLILSLGGIGYVAAGLAALGVSRLNETGPDESAEGAAMAIGGPIAGVLLLSVTALALVSANFIGWLGTLVSPVWDLIASIIAFALTALVYPLLLLAVHFHLGGSRVRFRSPFANRPTQAPVTHATHHGVTLLSVLGTIVAVLVVLMVVALVAFLILRATRSGRQKRRERERREERRTLVTPRDALRLFLRWLRGLFGQGAANAVRAVEAARHSVLGPRYPADPVRRLYAQVLYRAARQGLQRSGATTPAEFEVHLRRRWPEGSREFAAVTRAYMQRRYAERPLTEEDVRRLRDHWQHLRRVMRAPS